MVWKSIDHGHSWSRISPDLTRATWDVPANAGKYASTVKPAPMGSITALSPSPRSIAILWAGTDDGNIQVTRDGGVTWTNVTPPSIKPWTRIFNIEAGHFDPLVAYAAANTLRLDEIAPHFYRTRDGGKTWTEINTGIAGDAVANTIREDPRQPGLLYAGTDTQVWVSFDDGDHWQSLRHNMPAISVRDLQVKDDAKCRCADLIAGTHGRGFWILDNVTPLRQAAAAKAALAKNEPYLFKPGPAVRVRFGVNEPTPWPPELPAGESAPPGALIDYYLREGCQRSGARSRSSTRAGKVVRTLFEHRTGLRSGSGQGHGRVRRGVQEDADGRVLRPATLLARAAVHRLAQGGNAPIQLGPQVRSGVARRPGSRRRRGGDWSGARAARIRTTTCRGCRPGRTPSGSPSTARRRRSRLWSGSIRECGSRRRRWPTLNTLSTELYWEAVGAHRAFNEARALATTLDTRSGPEVDAIKGELEALAPTGFSATCGVLRRRGGAGPATPSLEAVSNALQAAAMAMQAAEVAPTATQVAAAATARAQARPVMAQWAAVKAKAASLPK